jgi:hypothetical protein
VFQKNISRFRTSSLPVPAIASGALQAIAPRHSPEAMQVLLIHGLARTSLSLLTLEWRLQAAGYNTEHFGYFAFAESFDQIADRLWQRLDQLAQQGDYAVVAHSLGGVLTRAALSLKTVADPQHIIMLGTPNQPPRLASYAWHVPPFRWFTGQCGWNLTCAEFYRTLPGFQSPYTIIAGTGGFTGAFSPFGDDLNDGIVALNETRLSPHDRIVELPVWHTFMMNYPEVQHSVLQLLQP